VKELKKPKGKRQQARLEREEAKAEIKDKTGCGDRCCPVRSNGGV